MAAETLLALWNDTPTRRAIVNFVQAVTTEGSPGFVAPAELVGQDPSLAERQPYRAAVERDFRWLVYKSKVEFFDDGPTKPVRIWSRVGYRPLVTGGNIPTHGWTVVSMKEDWSAVFASA